VSAALTQRLGIADPAMLARYQRRHRAGALPLYLGTGMIVGLYTDDRALMQPLRQAVMGSMRHMRPLRNALAAVVADVPPFTILRGLGRGTRPHPAYASAHDGSARGQVPSSGIA
jgi:hypothetical protein